MNVNLHIYQHGIHACFALERREDFTPSIRDLSWDEMLGELARLHFRPETTRWYGYIDDLPESVEVIAIEEAAPNSGEYTLRRGEQFTGRFTFNELLAFIACYTRTGEEIFGGFHTYEEFLRHRPWYTRVKPIALIEQKQLIGTY